MKERKTIRSGMNSFVLLERNLDFPPLMVGCLFVCKFVVLVAGATADHPTPPHPLWNLLRFLFLFFSFSFSFFFFLLPQP
jgi:hypothetical protein